MSQTFSSWRCWLCGATQAKNESGLNSGGFSQFNHLRTHEREGLLRRSTLLERKREGGVFQLTDKGREYLKARQEATP